MRGADPTKQPTRRTKPVSNRPWRSVRFFDRLQAGKIEEPVCCSPAGDCICLLLSYGQCLEIEQHVSDPLPADSPSVG